VGWYHLRYVAVTFVHLCLTEHPAQKYCNPTKVKSGTSLLEPGNLHPCRSGANSLLTNRKWTSEFYQGYRTEYFDTCGSCIGFSIKFYLSAYNTPM